MTVGVQGPGATTFAGTEKALYQTSERTCDSHRGPSVL
jgi:hypothetical protein